MGILSNLSFFRPQRSFDETAPVELRPARDAELESAIRLILARPDGTHDPAQADNFLNLARAHRHDAGGLWVADQNGRLLSALLPLVSPGRTMLLFLPSSIAPGFQERLTGQLVEQACRRAAAQGVYLAQALLEISDKQTQRTLLSGSFLRLAELIYLQSLIPRGLKLPPLPHGYHLITYAAETHAIFSRAILTSYQQSLDCPALSGLRDVEDILAGHRATGEFDPAGWFVLMEGTTPAATLLLSRIPRSDVTELVYLGIAPSHRGRGLGDLLMRHAMALLSGTSHPRLSLAVDANNTPALKLYWRHGMQAVGRKTAMMRDLRTP